jgi:hypothetical protein
VVGRGIDVTGANGAVPNGPFFIRTGNIVTDCHIFDLQIDLIEEFDAAPGSGFNSYMGNGNSK